MSHFFDGNAGLLNDLFGDPVEVQFENGAEDTIQGVFRREPTEVVGEDGFPVLTFSPTLKVPETVTLARGDVVVPSIAKGVRYVVMNDEASPSPASDRFVIYELEVEP